MVNHTIHLHESHTNSLCSKLGSPWKLWSWKSLLQARTWTACWVGSGTHCKDLKSSTRDRSHLFHSARSECKDRHPDHGVRWWRTWMNRIESKSRFPQGRSLFPLYHITWTNICLVVEGLFHTLYILMINHQIKSNWIEIRISIVIIL